MFVSHRTTTKLFHVLVSAVVVICVLLFSTAVEICTVILSSNDISMFEHVLNRLCLLLA